MDAGRAGRRRSCPWRRAGGTPSGSAWSTGGPSGRRRAARSSRLAGPAWETRWSSSIRSPKTFSSPCRCSISRSSASMRVVCAWIRAAALAQAAIAVAPRRSAMATSPTARSSTSLRAPDAGRPASASTWSTESPVRTRSKAAGSVLSDSRAASASTDARSAAASSASRLASFGVLACPAELGEVALQPQRPRLRLPGDRPGAACRAPLLCRCRDRRDSHRQPCPPPAATRSTAPLGATASAHASPAPPTTAVTPPATSGFGDPAATAAPEGLAALETGPSHVIGTRLRPLESGGRMCRHAGHVLLCGRLLGKAAYRYRWP